MIKAKIQRLKKTGTKIERKESILRDGNNNIKKKKKKKKKSIHHILGKVNKINSKNNKYKMHFKSKSLIIEDEFLLLKKTFE